MGLHKRKTLVLGRINKNDGIMKKYLTIPTILITIDIGGNFWLMGEKKLSLIQYLPNWELGGKLRG